MGNTNKRLFLALKSLFFAFQTALFHAALLNDQVHFSRNLRTDVCSRALNDLRSSGDRYFMACVDWAKL